MIIERVYGDNEANKDYIIKALTIFIQRINLELNLINKSVADNNVSANNKNAPSTGRASMYHSHNKQKPPRC